MLRAEREHERVVARGGLELEVERAADPLARDEAERAVDPAAERRVHDELHAAALVEEALHDDPPLARQRAERDERRLEVGDDLRGARRRRAPRAPRPRRAPRAAPPATSWRATSSRSAETSCESSGLRAGASPSQNGTVGGAPCASRTRTTPASTRRICHDVLPSRNTSPAMLSIAQSSFTVPTVVSSGSATTR